MYFIKYLTRLKILTSNLIYYYRLRRDIYHVNINSNTWYMTAEQHQLIGDTRHRIQYLKTVWKFKILEI